MNITKEQKEQEKLNQSIINPELYSQIKGKKIKYSSREEFEREIKKTDKKIFVNKNIKEIYVILEILMKVLGYSFLFVDLTLGVFSIMIGEIFRVINR